MNDFVEELVNHRKFIDLPEDEVDEKMKVMKKESPKSIPYALCWMEMHPGYASIRYVSSANPRSHLIGITPNGFTWCESNFPSLDQLLNEFKKYPKGPTKTVSTAAPITSKTATTSAATTIAAPTTRWGSRPAPPSLPPPPAQTGWTRPNIPPNPPPFQPTPVAQAQSFTVPVRAQQPSTLPAAASGWGSQQSSTDTRPVPPPAQPAATNGSAQPSTSGWSTSATGWGVQPSGPPASTGWGSQTPATSGWGSQPPSTTGWGSEQGRPPPARPPPPNLPPRRDPVPPPNLPPPPTFARPPSNAPPQPPKPPPPRSPPPSFDAPPGGAVGRGRGRTLPAWMSKAS
jgi:SH2 domain